MNHRDRSASLRRILEQHRGWERRTLADLRNAGFEFASVDEAKKYAAAEEALARMTPDQIIRAYLQVNNERKTA